MSTFYGGPELFDVSNYSASTGANANVNLYIVPFGRYAVVQVDRLNMQAFGVGGSAVLKVGEAIYSDPAPVSADIKNFYELGAQNQVLTEGQTVNITTNINGFGAADITVQEFVDP